ncbi:hypothetical protein G9A89_022289 [Geosiphon pyriformis]|nr:hypothetical protein G9A89_022289 [Geosiphon pyriformis]
MANVKVKRAMPSKILKIKNNLSEPVNIILIPNPDVFLDIETGPEEFHKHYQNLALTKKEQKQYLEQLNTQLSFRSSLVKKRINIREEIIDTGYVGNIIAMLQNDSEKTYIIEPNKKIAQAIFLPLVKIAQLVSMKNRKKLGITAREIQRFKFMGRIDILVNITEKKIVDKREIIFTHQLISILPYD